MYLILYSPIEIYLGKILFSLCTMKRPIFSCVIQRRAQTVLPKLLMITIVKYYLYLNFLLVVSLNPTLCDKVCQWLATGRWFSPGTPVYSTNKTDCYDITEILLKVALSTINQPTINFLLFFQCSMCRTDQIIYYFSSGW